MGIALWAVAGIAAFLIARIIPTGRVRAAWNELSLAIATALLLGVAATALDFGGWREALEWRAAAFCFCGSLAAIALMRGARLRSTPSTDREER